MALKASEWLSLIKVRHILVKTLIRIKLNSERLKTLIFRKSINNRSNVEYYVITVN